MEGRIESKIARNADTGKKVQVNQHYLENPVMSNVQGEISKKLVLV